MKIQYLNRDEFFEKVKAHIKPAKCVVDIGCGIRPQSFIAPEHHICFEPHQQYIDHFNNDLNKDFESKYSFINGDWKCAVDILQNSSVDTVFLLDVIEHLEKNDAMELIKKTIPLVSQQVIIFTPYGFIEQNHADGKDAWGLDGGKWQEHRSGWMPEDFGDEWEFLVCRDFHTHDNLNNPYDEPKGAMFAILDTTKNEARNTPVFSIIIPTYNQADYLAEALDSVLNQTFPLWEAVIVNDGSTDHTKDVIEKYIKLDKRFRAFHKENGGVATALNLGIENAKADWICWLSSDDLFVKDKLEVHLNAIVKYPDIKFFHSHWYILQNENKKIIAPGLWLPIPPNDFQVTRFFIANYIHGNAICINREVFKNVGLFDGSSRQGQDFDMWLRISAKYISHYIDKRTCITRIHPGQTTNSFVEGGILDSTRSIINFINSSKFPELFPFSDLKEQKNILAAINEIIYISTKQEAFLYRCGFTTALAEKCLEWLSNSLPNSVRESIHSHISQIISKYLTLDLPEEIKNILKMFPSKKKIFYKNHDFITDSKNYISSLIKKGDQQQAKAIETYFIKLLKPQNYFKSSEGYNPIILNYPLNDMYLNLNGASILTWDIFPGSLPNNTIIHQMKVQCEKCSKKFRIKIEYEMKTLPVEQSFICPECKTGYKFNDEHFRHVFNDFTDTRILQHAEPRPKNKVVFFIKDASILGGGTKILFKYAELLMELGEKVEVVSFSKRPDWISSIINYTRINSINDLKNDVKLFIIFSIFDLPFCAQKIPLNKIVHLCQGYEGYHFGRSYDELRSDKHILTMLHSIPIRNIVISAHLVKLFKEKFSRETYLIPNSVDNQIFRFNTYDATRERSILYVGNPFHQLKGFSFLANTIATIQSTPLRIHDLKLYIVMGFKPDNLSAIKENLSKELNCEIDIQFKLTSSEMAKLMQSVSVVVSTSWYEGFSLPVLEAMSCGTPVITTKNMGAESFCIPDENALVVKYGDNENLSRYLLDILYRASNLEKLIINASKTAAAYSELNFISSFINTFEKLLSKDFPLEKIEIMKKKYSAELLKEPAVYSSKEKNKTNLKLSVIVPVFNQLDYTQKFLDSLLKTSNMQFETIIIDNASDAETEKYLKELEDSNIIQLIRNEKNLGFPVAVNQGITASSGEFILIANNDIILTDGCLEKLIEVAESDSSVGIVGPISNEVSGFQKDNDAKYETIDEMHLYASDLAEKNTGELIIFPRVAFLCTLIKREVIEKIGGLDERFSPGNYEDDDFCLRNQLAGYKTAIAKGIFVHHFGSKSFKSNGTKSYSEILHKNRQKFIDKWGADPDDIWIRKKEFKHTRNLFISVSKNEFTKRFERTKSHLHDEEFDYALSEIELAIAAYDLTTESDQFISKHDLLILAANLCLVNGDNEKAKSFFGESLTINPDSSSACLGLGQTLFNQEQYEQAKIMLEWAIKNDHKNKEAIHALKVVNEILSLPLEHNSLTESFFDNSVYAKNHE